MILPLISLIIILCQLNHCLSSDPSVVIVGAGPAGIAAATKLLENSVTNITILEAENRIGGRVHSVEFGDAFVDIGAEYCHGEKGNIVYELAKDLHILEPGPQSLQDNVYYSNGSKIDSSLVDEFELIFNEYQNGDHGDYNTTGKSLGDLFLNRYNTKILKEYQTDPAKLKILKEGLRFSEGYVLQPEGSFSWFDSSVDSDYQDCEGNQIITWNGRGYKTILEILMKSYPDPDKRLPIDDKIHLNEKVTKINWNTGKNVNVQTVHNASYSADYVIFTPSVGVLKEQHGTLFNPPLPRLKQAAIETTGFAGVIKLFMYFPTKWWKDDDKIISFFWSQEDLNGTDFPGGPSKNGVSWVAQFRNVLQAPNNPNVLVGWITGDLVPEVEKLPLDTLKNGCAYVFKKFLGKAYNVTEIGRIMRSTWYSNENFRGTYSYTKAGLYNPDWSYQSELAKPLDVAGRPALLFAGEATNPIHYSTVHGAIETGHREAERIIRLHNNVK
ncbi:spermine oxidase [Asbolus verrucosus]|uniref:Spermine oxidase n=1 Tax=Asbolus verrucosus TaxID=1661398 RepID=A0A482VCY4_ASBVE|nr:spermine oxidase [Asbolus verrucosus]